MDALLRDTLFGRLVNCISNDRCFSHLDCEWQGWTTNTQAQLSFANSSEDIPALEKIVELSGPDDPAIPRNWSSSIKALVALNVLFLNFSFYSASAIFTPSMEGIEKEFSGTTNEGTLGLSLFVIAYGIGPLITILILRFIAGFVGSAPISIGGASLMEIYGPGEIGYAIALYAVSGVCGPILGPLLGTAVNLRWNTWRASVWLIVGVTAFTTVFTFFFLPETLSTNILLRRARRIRAKTDDQSCKTQTELAAPEKDFFMTLIKQTVDDFKLSCIDPVILFVNIDTMLIYGILYLWFEFFPYVFDGIYHFTALQQSLAFFGILVGAFISVTSYMLWLYFFYIPKTRDLEHPVEPEARLRPGQNGTGNDFARGVLTQIESMS
ncbi:hypothetical protein KEM56_000661 [Ascosphaera pollenicola]|nr:hypothetical protein KEM56_000661 [Ascosphaera pollenicola]